MSPLGDHAGPRLHAQAPLEVAGAISAHMQFVVDEPFLAIVVELCLYNSMEGQPTQTYRRRHL